MLTIIFWILWILCVISVVVPTNAYPWLPRLNAVISLILFGILGFKVLHVSL